MRLDSRWLAVIGGWIGFAGVLGFVVIVLVLHHLQPELDSRRQLVSELARSAHGWLLLFAFLLLAASLGGVAVGLRAMGTATVIPILHGLSAVAMVVAGVFPMGRATNVHIAAVAIGFALIVLAAYLLPARMGQRQSRFLSLTSWLFVASAIGSIGSASVGVPVGIAERLAVVCVLGWLCILSWLLVRFQWN